MSTRTLILVVLSCAQFALLLLIYSRTDAVSEDLQVSSFPSPIESFPHSDARSSGQMQSGSGSELITEHRLRQIIQEELQSHIRKIDLDSVQEETELPSGHDVDGAVMASRRDFVLGKLDFYSSVGAISSAEMAQLHMEIAKLDDSGRTEMMSRLNRALNSGALKGNL